MHDFDEKTEFPFFDFPIFRYRLCGLQDTVSPALIFEKGCFDSSPFQAKVPKTWLRPPPMLQWPRFCLGFSYMAPSLCQALLASLCSFQYVRHLNSLLVFHVLILHCSYSGGTCHVFTLCPHHLWSPVPKFAFQEFLRIGHQIGSKEPNLNRLMNAIQQIRFSQNTHYLPENRNL